MIRNAYDRNAQRLGGAPLDAGRGEIVAALDDQQRDAARDAFVERLRAEPDVESLLGPFRVLFDTAGHPGAGWRTPR